MRPLAGITVLDFSTLLPGPLASLLLAEAGADVVKIERPRTGEEMRNYAPNWGRESVNFSLLNRGKKSLALNLKDPDDRQALRPLLEKADVLIEQFRPGVMAKLGLDYETAAAINPGIIYCSITGYGQAGPKRDLAGHDLNYISDTGLLSLSMGTSTAPVVPPALIADIAGGTYPAVMNILLALLEKRLTGKGRRLDVAMTDNLFTFMYWAIGKGRASGQWPGNGTELVTGGTPRYRLYPTGDEKFVAAAPIEEKFWQTFCELIELEPGLRDDAENADTIGHRVAEIIRSKPAEHWRRRFAGKDCCCSIVVSIEEALADPHFKARGIFEHMLINEEGARMPALPVPIDAAFRADPQTAIGAPALGSENDELSKTSGRGPVTQSGETAQ
ncbi:MAG: CoA transferase [Mesorhizobium sp.]|uniref:CaiB/BaiF CoA transferase family protein n=1 Tax=Mesorhizobium sp. TaxID=1871066 RepID=UPI0011FD1C4A|nr:CaiB/BaiF CoA-transferase family protein [Mesorhizobium sp.]TIL32453.1 MAG: CoA transferase [Mesorhizobium sp.]TIM40330.1 MAG: CoA transferase [Mesorhizobium sp.]